MVGKKPNKGQAGKIIIFPSDRCAKVREGTGDKLPSDGALVSYDLVIADTECIVRQIEDGIVEVREIVLGFLLDSGYMTMNQVQINEETNECFIDVDGKKMKISEFLAHLRRMRMAEETALRQNSKKTD